MFTPILSPPKPGRHFRHLLGLAGGLCLLGSVSAQAQTVYGLNRAGNVLVTTTVGSLAGGGMPTTQPITNVAPGQTLVGFDSRPATGELFALGYNGTGTAQLYTINKTSAVATPVGSPQALVLGTSFEGIGVDFNPTVDRIRVTSTNDFNYRLNPNTGAVAATDMALNFATGSPFAGQDPIVGSVAYTNSFIGTASTLLYDIDESRSTLFTQNLPNNGTLVTPFAITRLSAALLATGDQTDFDIYTDPSTRAQTTLLARTRTGTTSFYTLDLSNGNASLVSSGTPGLTIDDIAFGIDRTAPAASGQRLYAVSTNSTLLSFDSGTPNFILSAVAITGVATGQTLVGTDFRPNTGQLFGLGYNPATGEARLYIIDQATAVATAVGTAPVTLDLGSTAAAADAVGFDFNPTVDRIRVTGSNARNFRLNPNNGAIAATDGNLNFVAGATGVPTIGAVAYINSFAGSSSTTLYDIDDVRNQLFIQSNPNAGQLTAVAGPGLLPSSATLNDLDFYFDAVAQTNRGFLVSNADASMTPAAFSMLYTLDQVAATTTAVGTIGLGIPVRDVTAFIAPLTQPTLVGRLFYGIAGGNLISFDSGNPNNIRTAVNITGLPTDGSQVIAGADFRSLGGQLYVLGYNATASQGQLYTLNLSTGALSAVGGLNALVLGGASAIGFDFNPAADRLRIVATNGNNYRINPADGSLVTAADGSTGRALSATAYINNDNNTATPTTQYGYDQVTNELVVFSNPNAGTNTTVGSSTIVVNTATGVDFDIFSDVTNPAVPVNTAFAAAALTGSTTDVLYDVNLGSGAFTSLGRIGNGSNLSGIAAFFTPAPILPTGLTWTGATNTDWGLASNWSTMQVPLATDNVTIPDVTNDPVVSNAQQANSVSLGAGAMLTTADGGVLSVFGSFVNSGGTVTSTGAARTGEVRFAGATVQTIAGSSTTFLNLTAGPAGVALSGPVRVQRLLTLNGNTTANSNLTLLSSASGTATVVNTAGAVMGTATVQRFIDPSLNSGLGYRHYSAPTSNSPVADLAAPGFAPEVSQASAYNSAPDPTQVAITPFPNVFKYNETRVTTNVPANGSRDFDRGFEVPASMAEALEFGRGYAVNIAPSALVDFTGTLNNAPANQTVTGLTRGSLPQSGWHLRGNPFPSALDWTSLLTNGRAVNLENALYVFKSSGQYTGSYASFIAGVGTNGGTNVLPVAQGFFVRTVAGQTGSLAFNNADRITTADATPFQRTTPDVRPQLTLALANPTVATQAAVYFEQGATADFDRAYDARNLPAPNGLTLATEAGNDELAINGRPALTGADALVALRLAVATAGTYTLRVDNLANLPAGYHAYLRDALAGTYTDLATTPSISLALAANGAAGGRFALLFTTQTRVLASAPAALAQLASVFPNPARGTATLLLPAALRGGQATNVSVIDNVGRVVLTRTLAAGATETLALPLTGLAPGVYAVQARTAAGLVVKRLVVE